jgi:hypothetical protein
MLLDITTRNYPYKCCWNWQNNRQNMEHQFIALHIQGLGVFIRIWMTFSILIGEEVVY